MISDTQLLHLFAREKSETSFAELVRRHLGWVYHAALRRAGGRHDLAEDAAQHVFTLLAQNPGALSHHPSLVGWLHVATGYAVRRCLRAEARRGAREAVAGQTMYSLDRYDENAQWEKLRPALDDVLDRLAVRDRHALLLRFFQGLAYSEVGRALNLSEDGARKRVDRALEKLRSLLGRRGITSSVLALETLLRVNASAAVETKIQLAVTAAALASSTGAGVVSLGFFSFMGAMKTTLLSAASLALTGVLILSLIGTALRDFRAADAALARVAAEDRVSTARQDLLDRLQRARLENAHSATEPIALPSTPTASREGSASSLSQTDRQPRDPRADGKAFLAAYPQVRAMLDEVRRLEVGRDHAFDYRLAGLTGAQVQAFESLIQQNSRALNVTPTSINPIDGGISEKELRALLGDSAFKRWEDAQPRRAAAQWVKALALSVNRGDSPMTVEQLLTLERIVADHSAEFHGGGAIQLSRVDWEGVRRAAKTVLSETQWPHAEAKFLREEVERQAEMFLNQKNKK